MEGSASGDAAGAGAGGHHKAGLVIGAAAFALIPWAPVPAGLAASHAFMMPVATPPNAIVFGSGHITIPQMVRAGILLNMLGVALITAFSYTVVMAVLGIEAGVTPDWALGGNGG